MWCSTCQHDVLLPDHAGAEFVRCPQCGTTVGFGHGSLATAVEQKPLVVPTIPDEDWQIEADIRSVHRLLDSLRPVRVDAPAAIGAPHVPVIEREQQMTTPPSPTGLVAWTLVSLSAAALACGAVLIGWSVTADRADLWQIGLPLAIGGQAGLLIGLALYLEGLWRTSRSQHEPAPAREVVIHAASPLPAPHGLAELSSRLDTLSRQLSRSRA
jgi:hypothetical protein